MKIKCYLAWLGYELLILRPGIGSRFFFLLEFAADFFSLKIERWLKGLRLSWKFRARSIQPKFQPVRPGKVVHLNRWTRFFETFPVGPNRSIEFWTEISGNFG